MNAANFRFGFGLLCLAGLIAVAVGAVLEIGRARRAAQESMPADGAPLVGVNQFRLRILSAVVWMIVLGALAYATMFLWPTPGDMVTARRFVALVSGAVSLIVIGLFLLAYDMWLVSRRRRMQEKYFERQLNEMAQAEIERLAAQHPPDSINHSRPLDSPPSS